MGKRIKKSEKGEDSKFLTKGKAMRKLQLKSKQFHRLCILKGIYPREPKKKQDHTKTFYHVKDIKYLGHEELLNKFREIDAWHKKIKKAIVKRDKLKATILKENSPGYSLSHLVKERYPRFTDALRDLDDALSLICLFASCPSNRDLKIGVDMVRMSERLWHEFEKYVMVSKSLRKSFLSIKGIYYQAEVKGQILTWLVPYQYSQHLPLDVDYSIMLTFLEFYHTLTRFVLFKLYQELDVSYPLDLEQSIPAFLATVNPVKEEFEVPVEFSDTPEYHSYIEQQRERKTIQELFGGLVFYCGRETPVYSLELIIRSCGGEISTEASDSITHQVIDRPLVSPRTDREYVQPQWLYDCLNFSVLLPVNQYKPGCELPPHLSPFVDYKQEEYVPDRLAEIYQIKGINIESKNEIEVEKKEMAQAMMTKKIRNLYTRMQFIVKRKRAKLEIVKQRKARS